MEIKQISIKGNQIGIIGLDEVFQVAKEAQISDESILKDFLLEGVKQRNYIPTSAENDYKIALHRAYRRSLGEVVEEEETGLVIKILGQGCPRCDQIEKDVIAALQELNLSADVEHVRDLKEISKYGIIAIPGLIINKKIFSTGKVPNRHQLKEWLLEAMRLLNKKSG